MNLFKKEKENPQIEEKITATVMENGTERPVTVPASGKLQEIKQAQEKAAEQAKALGKFFTLEIGEKTKVTIDFDRTETFKTKTKAGDLVDQFRYYLLDHRYNREKQFDTWVNVSQAIVHNIENGHYEMTIKCLKNQMGGRKYIVVPYEDEE